MAKKYHPVSPLSVVSEFFEKLVNNTLVDHPEKCGFIFYFQYGFWSSQSTADLLTVSFDRIGRLFNSSGVTRTVALEHAGLLHKLKPYGITGQISLVLVIDGFKRLWDVLFQLGLTFFLMTLQMMLSVISLSILMVLLLQLELASELDSDLHGTVEVSFS